MDHLNDDDYWELTKNLRQFPRLFQVLWSCGIPQYTSQVPTAGVGIIKDLNQIVFLINPDFFKQLTPVEKSFVLCHEALHLLLEHLFRTSKTLDPTQVNKAMDIVVNHLIHDQYSINRERLTDWKQFCWKETCFSEEFLKENEVKLNETWFYYYKLLESQKEKNQEPSSSSSSGSGSSGGAGQQFDQHSIQDMEDGDGNSITNPDNLSKEEKKAILSEIGAQLNEQLTNEEKEDLKKMLGQAFGKEAGLGSGHIFDIVIPKSIPKPKWETVIKNKVASLMKKREMEKDVFVGTARRNTMLPKDMILTNPKEYHKYEQDKYNVVFFVDTSGSLYNEAKRLFKVIGNIPEDKFIVKLCCFDTSVYEIDPKNPKAVGGGGTRFDILESWVQQHKQKYFSGKYPDIVFVLTDGYGNSVNPEKPKSWAWLMTEKALNYIPKESKWYNLKDFE